MIHGHHRQESYYKILLIPGNQPSEKVTSAPLKSDYKVASPS